MNFSREYFLIIIRHLSPIIMMPFAVGTDVICVYNPNKSEFFSTEFSVEFSFAEVHKIYMSSLGLNQYEDWRSTSLTYSNTPPKQNPDDCHINFGGYYAHALNRIGSIEAYCNGVHCPLIQLSVDDSDNKGVVYFKEPNGGGKTTSPSSATLKHFDLKMGANEIRFYSRNLNVSAIFFCYMWDVESKIVVFDIDGTLTISDVRGYIETVYLQIYTYVHEGAAELMRLLEEATGVHFLYLTSRPLMHRDETRKFIDECTQNGFTFPRGPLITNTRFLGTVIYEEMFSKHISKFKAKSLLTVCSIFNTAGRKYSRSPFFFGFGNKDTDARAYQAAGVPSNKIFVLSKQSEISIWNGDPRYMDTDPNADNFVEGELSNTIDLTDVGAQTEDDRLQLYSTIFKSYSDERLISYIRSCQV